MVQKPGRHCLLYRTVWHRPVTGRQRPTGEKGMGELRALTRASLHSSPATLSMINRHIIYESQLLTKVYMCIFHLMILLMMQC